MTKPNYFDRAGAIKIKDWIERYWSARGYHVNVEIIEAPFSNHIRSARFDVRSDMVNGMPRHKPTEAVRRPKARSAA
jgi:hypothetical protein